MQTLTTSQHHQVKGGLLPVAGLSALVFINTTLLQLTGAAVAAGAGGYFTYKYLSFLEIVNN